MSPEPGRPSRTVSDVMITDPKTHPADATVGCVRDAWDNAHLRMVLLTDAGKLHGTILRGDIPAVAPAAGRALDWATSEQRNVGPHEAEVVLHRRLIASGERRLAVVNADQHLLGLLCLKRDRTGFCTVADLHARARDREAAATCRSAATQAEVSADRRTI